MARLQGFVNLLKPPGMTSHDVMDVVRHELNVKHVGHAGTLDPAAAGVLVAGIGFAARLFEFIADLSKSYRAEICFGAETDTGDAHGRVISTGDATQLTEEEVRQVITHFVGDIIQQPPIYSAVQVAGRRLHQLARRGIAIETPLRKVSIHQMELLRFEPGIQPRTMLNIECSSGTYIRSLATDIGRRCGCGAHLSFLVRTRVGSFRIEESVTLDQLAEAVRRDAVASLMVSPQHALAPIPTLTANEEAKKRILNGNLTVMAVKQRVTLQPGALTLIEDETGQVLAIARCQSRDGNSIAFQPMKVIDGGNGTCR